jgi:F-box/WD-40 domain protein 7
VAGPLAFSGGGDGSLIAHDVSEGCMRWGIGANKAAVRCIGTTSDSLVAAGDDGNAIIWHFD